MKKITILLSFIACVVFAHAQKLFSENFNNVTTTAVADANGNIAGTRDIAIVNKLDSAIVTTTGWTGAKVYTSNGRFKLGTSSIMGNITTPAIDLSASNFTISVDLASWNNTGNIADTGSSIDVQVDGVVVATIPYTTTMSTYITPSISSKTATSKITFTAKVAKNRFYFDNVLVQVATATGISVPKAENVLNVSVSGKNLSVKNAADGAIVDIYSAVGARVQSSKLENSAIQLNELSKGLYIVRVGNLSSKIML